MGYVQLGSATDSTVLQIQGVLKNFGYLSSADVDGVIGSKTMTAILALGRNTLDDFAGSINAAPASLAQDRTAAESYFRAAQNKLNEAQSGGKFSGNYSALVSAQTKLKQGWSFWASKGGRAATARANAFLSMTIPVPAGTPTGSDEGLPSGAEGGGSPPSDDTILGMSPLTFALGAAGVGLLAWSLLSSKS